MSKNKILIDILKQHQERQWSFDCSDFQVKIQKKFDQTQVQK